MSDDKLHMYVWKKATTSSGRETKHIVSGTHLSSEEIQEMGVSFENIYNKLKKAFPSSEGFSIQCKAERSEEVDVDFESTTLGTRSSTFLGTLRKALT